MAKCNQCGKEVGCPCNLVNGKCKTCASTKKVGQPRIKPEAVKVNKKVGTPIMPKATA